MGAGVEVGGCGMFDCWSKAESGKPKAVVLTLRSVGLLTLLDKILLVGASMAVFGGLVLSRIAGKAREVDKIECRMRNL